MYIINSCLDLKMMITTVNGIIIKNNTDLNELHCDARCETRDNTKEEAEAEEIFQKYKQSSR